MYAIYARNLYVLVYLSVLLTATIILGIWEFSFPGDGRERSPWIV